MAEITLLAVRDNLDTALSFMNTELDKADRDVSPEFRMHLELSLEEMFTNISDYAYKEGYAVAQAGEYGFLRDGGNVTLGVKTVGDGVYVSLVDCGAAFDPLAVPAPDRTTALAERDCGGGFGVYMAKKFTDRISYERVGELNKLTMFKFWN